MQGVPALPQVYATQLLLRVALAVQALAATVVVVRQARHTVTAVTAVLEPGRAGGAAAAVSAAGLVALELVQIRQVVVVVLVLSAVQVLKRAITIKAVLVVVARWGREPSPPPQRQTVLKVAHLMVAWL